MPARSLRITFSARSAVRDGVFKSTSEKEKPPVLALSLWQPEQYWLTNACRASADIEAEAGVWDGAVCECACPDKIIKPKKASVFLISCLKGRLQKNGQLA